MKRTYEGENEIKSKMNNVDKSYENLMVDLVKNRIDHSLKVYLFDTKSSLYEEVKNGKKLIEKKNSEIMVGDIILLHDKSQGILECEVTIVNDTGIGICFIHEYRRHIQILYEPWFSLVRDGTKAVDGRLNRENSWVTVLKRYDIIEFNKGTPGGLCKDKNNVIPKIEVLVLDVKKYKRFTDIFDDVGIEKVLPGYKTYDQGVAVYRQWYSEEHENKFGVVGIFMKVI